MAAAYDISGRRIRWEYLSNKDLAYYEFEIVGGSVSDHAQVAHYLPIGYKIAHTITYGRIVTYQFTGVLLSDWLPWYDLTPMTPVSQLYVTANRFIPGNVDPDEPEEVYHYSANAVVASIDHVFETSQAQLFQITIFGDGSYVPPTS
jgi:hypothetical protein